MSDQNEQKMPKEVKEACMRFGLDANALAQLPPEMAYQTFKKTYLTSMSATKPGSPEMRVLFDARNTIVYWIDQVEQ